MFTQFVEWIIIILLVKIHSIFVHCGKFRQWTEMTCITSFELLLLLVLDDISNSGKRKKRGIILQICSRLDPL